MMSYNSSSQSQAYWYLLQEVFGLRDILRDDRAPRDISDGSPIDTAAEPLGSEVWLWVTDRHVLELPVFERMNAAILQEGRRRGLQIKIAWIDEKWWRSQWPQDVSVGCLVFTDAGLADVYKQTLGDNSEVLIEVLPHPSSYDVEARLKSVAWKKVQFILSQWSRL